MRESVDATSSRFLWPIVATVFLVISVPGFAQVEPQVGRPSSPPPTGVEPLPRQPSAGSVVPISSDLGQDRTVRVLAIGRAAIYGGNIDKARDAALRSAYAEAVGRGAGISVGSLTIVTNVKKVSDVVMSRSRGFVKSYDVISEGVVAEGSYEIRIEAEVVVEGVTEEDEIDGLRLYLQVLGNPKLLVVLPRYDLQGGGGGGTTPGQLELEYRDPETDLIVRRSGLPAGQDGGSASVGSGSDEPEGAFRGTEAAIAQAFSRYGYQVFTSDDVVSTGLVPPDVLRRARQGVTEDAVAVARATDADLALFGVLRVSSQHIKPYGVEFVSVTGEASAKALIVSSGYVVEAFHTTRTKAHPNPLGASSAVLDEIAREFASTLAWKIPEILVNHPRESRLVLDGVTIEQAEKVKAALAGLPDVDAVRFSQLPAEQNGYTAALVVTTGFVRAEDDLLFEVCREAIGRVPIVERFDGRCSGFAVSHHDKYEIRLQRCDVKIL